MLFYALFISAIQDSLILLAKNSNTEIIFLNSCWIIETENFTGVWGRVI